MLKMDLNDFAKSYLTLGLRINKHINGYVEHYYGPSKIKKKVDLEEKISPKVLVKDYFDLCTKLEKQGYDSNRFKFFDKTLIAIGTILRKLDGENIPYIEQVQNFFDFTPRLYNDDSFLELSIKAENVYKGKGNLSQRMESYTKKRKVPKEELENLFSKALQIAKQKTMELFPNLLPKNEKIIIEKVKDESWVMYN
jgi:hypothetical protein